MQIIHYTSESRGRADYGWLKTKYSFSFSSYFDPSRMGFGLLRVLNDDFILGGGGFPLHPHDNMEIITIVLDGSIEHKDSMGNSEQLKKGEIQVMSAGSGLTHSEYNASKTEPLSLFQIWIMPHEINIKPRYEQTSFTLNEGENSLITLVGHKGQQDKLWINQYAWISMGVFDEKERIEYKMKRCGNGAFVMVVEGTCEIDGKRLNNRDAIGVIDALSFTINILKPNTHVLIIDVPME